MSSVNLLTFPGKARKETSEHHTAVRDMIEQFTLMVSQIFFPSTAIAPAAGALTAEVEVLIGDDSDVRMLFGDNVVKRVQVNVAGGTAAGGEVSADGVNYGANAILTFDKGRAVAHVKATGTGTVILSLTDVDGSGLTLGGNATVTFS